MLANMEAQSGLGQAETGVQARARMRRADALAAQSCRARTLAVAADSDHGSGRGWDSRLRWDGRSRERE